MSRKWIIILFVSVGAVFFLVQPATPILAQEPTPENDANCVSCHEHQYYLYDSGKWFCLCEAPMHCVYCHGGRTDSFVEEVAHEGIVLYPTRNHAERCQTCHTEDYMARVVTFETVAGVSETPKPLITATPMGLIENLLTEAKAQPFFRIRQLEPWRLAGLGLIIVGLVVLVFFGYRCWKADCMSKLRS
jgi:hypothetical protein